MGATLPVASLGKGLAKLVPRHLIPEGGFFLSDNMALFKGELSVVPGFVQFNGQRLQGVGIMLIDEFPMESGVTHLLVFTTSKIYRYDNVDTFIEVGRTQPSPAPVRQPTVIPQIPGVERGQQSKTASWTQGVDRTLGPVMSGTRLVNPPLGPGGSVPFDYTGGLDDFWSGDVVVNPSGDLYFVATNYKRDPVQVWDGSVVTTFRNLTGSPADGGNHFSRAVAAFQNRLMHLNRTEAGVAKPRMVRWSDNGLPETYSGGESGFLTLFQGADHGVAFAPLGNYMVAYRERSIHLLSYVGSPFYISQRQVINGVGLLAPRAVLNLDLRHVFLGNDNVYIFNGVDIEAIGTEIRDDLFATMDAANSPRSLIIFSEPRNEMALIVPSTSNDGIPDTWYFYNFTTGTWSGPARDRLITGGGDFQKRA